MVQYNPSIFMELSMMDVQAIQYFALSGRMAPTNLWHLALPVKKMDGTSIKVNGNIMWIREHPKNGLLNLTFHKMAEKDLNEVFKLTSTIFSEQKQDKTWKQPRLHSKLPNCPAKVDRRRQLQQA
ncbi:uncharacterized protein LOC144212017 [Stigmatopora nigra]